MGLLGPRWCARCGGPLPNRSNEREVALCAVASSGLRPSRGSRVGCDRYQPFRSYGASCCGPEGEQFEDAPRDLKPSWRSGD